MTRIGLPVLGLATLMAAAVPAFGCTSSTKVESAWKAPDVQKLSFKKVLVVAISPSSSFRHEAEDAMQAEIKKAQVIKSYDVLPSQADVADRAKVESYMRDNQVDGVIVMRIVTDAQEVRYVPPSYPSSYNSFGGYYGPSAALAPYNYDPGYVSTHKVIGIETNVYESKDGRLIWSGLTKTWDPDNTKELVKETVEKVHDEMKDQELVP